MRTICTHFAGKQPSQSDKGSSAELVWTHYVSTREQDLTPPPPSKAFEPYLVFPRQKLPLCGDFCGKGIEQYSFLFELYICGFGCSRLTHFELRVGLWSSIFRCWTLGDAGQRPSSLWNKHFLTVVRLLLWGKWRADYYVGCLGLLDERHLIHLIGA